ncbi:MAG: lactamase, partial [Dehalococcoidia bacterium]
KIRAIPVNHIPGAMGFEVISEDGTGLFYTGDTGDGLSSVWENIKPNLMIIDLTFPNKLSHIAKESRHLCPQMIKAEMIGFNRIKGYIPNILITHMNPYFEQEISKEMEEVANELGINFIQAYEGLKLNV